MSLSGGNVLFGDIYVKYPIEMLKRSARKRVIKFFIGADIWCVSFAARGEWLFFISTGCMIKKYYCQISKISTRIFALFELEAYGQFTFY